MARSLFSQLQEILSDLWVVAEGRRDAKLPVERIKGVLDAAENYPTEDPEDFDRVVATARELLPEGDPVRLQKVLKELAEFCRDGATSYL